MDTHRGTMGRLPFAAVGTGEPVVFLAGLAPITGVDGDMVVRTALGPVRGLTSTHRMFLFNRRPGLPAGTTMGELAREHAEALRDGFGTPVDVAGISTGGSIAQQLAADHPDVVRRLVLVSTACRLGAGGRDLQKRVAELVRAGATRRALAVLAAGLVPPRRGKPVAAAAGYLLAGRLARNPRDLEDMATTIEAEDGFDLAECPTISAPTLVLAGARDRFYSPELFHETARRIPGSRLRLFDGRGHVTVTNDPGFRRDLAGFLAAPPPSGG